MGYTRITSSCKLNCTAAYISIYHNLRAFVLDYTYWRNFNSVMFNEPGECYLTYVRVHQPQVINQTGGTEYGTIQLVCPNHPSHIAQPNGAIDLLELC